VQRARFTTSGKPCPHGRYQSITLNPACHSAAHSSSPTGGIGLSNHKLVEDLVTNPVGLVDGVLSAPTGPGLGGRFVQTRQTFTA
jgi:hypothetical protein